MIYLDNAATTFPKPRRVREETMRAITEYGGNPGRGAHALSLAAAEKIFACRELLAEFLGLDAPERIIFTLNTTHALNLALSGLLRRGDHVLYSELEHNAVRRPICHMIKHRGISADTFPVLGLSEHELLAAIEQRIQPQTKALVCTHASNICSVALPLTLIGRLCRKRGLIFIVDGAQSAGHLPIHVREMQIDALAVPGHKGLYGIQGCGALLLGERFIPAPLMQGGSGLNSLDEEMPELPPERFEAGTLPTPAIAGLLGGVEFVKKYGLRDIAAHEHTLFLAARERLEALPCITVYQRERSGSVLLFHHAEIPPQEIARRLAREGICVRAGYHCAPLAHRAIGSIAQGAVRLSFSVFNTVAELDALWKALKS